MEPCLVAILVRRVRVSGSLALRGGAARQLRLLGVRRELTIRVCCVQRDSSPSLYSRAVGKEN